MQIYYYRNYCLCIILILGMIQLSNAANLLPDTEEFTVKNGVVLCKEGLPQIPLWFADGRLTFSYEKPGGITRLDYYYPNEGTSHSIFSRPHHWYGFNSYLVHDGVNYLPDFQNSKVYPFGIESEWQLEGFIFLYKVLAVDEGVVIQLKTPENLPNSFHFKLDFNQKFGISEENRKWDEWRFVESENLLTGGFSEGASDQLFSCILGADFPIQHSISEKNTKYFQESPVLEQGKTYTFFICFGSGSDAVLQKSKVYKINLEQKIADQYNRYRQVAESSPKLISPYKELNNYMELLPMFNEALKVRDYPGAVRANTNRYWVWGWDGITNSSSTAYWGDVEHLKNMLEFYKTTANPGKGIAHSYLNNMKIGEVAPIPAQCMYITLLQLYFDQTKDLEALKLYFPFAKKIFRMATETAIEKVGMSTGVSLFPDYRALLDETGNDLSTLNNSVFYCAVRSMNRLANVVGDKNTQKESEEISKRIEKNFINLFYDNDKNYIVSSVDASSFEQRKTYHISSLRWENDYYEDLISSISKECLNFFEKNLVCEAGIRETPVWDKSWDLDANQLSDWWPVTDESFIRLCNQYNRADLLEKWVGYLSYWYRNLTCPESVECYFDSNDPATPDPKNPGSWQAFAMRTWYQGVIHGLVGVDADAGGITFYPYNGKEMKLTGLHFLGKTFDFEMKGSGPYVEYLEVDGEKIYGTNKLPEEYYKNKGHKEVIVMRTVEAPRLFIKDGSGVIVTDYAYKNGKIKTKVAGAGLCRLRVYAAQNPIVKVNGRAIKTTYDTKLNLSVIELNLDYGKTGTLEIDIP